MLSGKLEGAVAKLPKRLREGLNSCPTKGNGVHDWLFGTAFRLHEWVSNYEIVGDGEDQIVKLVQAISDYFLFDSKSAQALNCYRPTRRDSVDERLRLSKEKRGMQE
jgi:hypothetical protein